MRISDDPPAAWELGGMVDPDTGILERPSRFDHWLVSQSVELDDEGDCLRWHSGAHAHYHEVQSGPGMLTDFAALAEDPPAAILRYARRWGALELCRHMLPRCHNPTLASPGSLRDVDDACQRLGYECGKKLSEQTYWEPLSTWRTLADRFRAILNVAASLYREEPAPPGDWQVALGHERETLGYGEWEIRPDFVGDAHLLGRAVNEVLEIADVRPALVWVYNEGWILTLRPGDGLAGCELFVALSTQLLYAVARTDGVAICSSCGRAYLPSRRPAKGRRRYCPRCKEMGAPVRDASRDYYQRHQR